MTKYYHTVLSIAGSDSIGGAGIQADIKSCFALGVYAMTAITAITAQNSTGVRCFEPVAPAMLQAQLDAVFADVTPDAVKIGMVPDATAAQVIADALCKYSAKNVVLDPVLVATSGDDLTDGHTRNAILRLLAPLATLITPNLHEAKALGITGAIGNTAALIKGGHQIDQDDARDTLTDALYLPDGTVVNITHPRVASRNTHGTGCSLSSAIASFLAKGYALTDAVTQGVEAVYRGIAAGADYAFGNPGGHGPICHFEMAKPQ